MQNLIFRLLTWEISVMLVSSFTCPRGLHNTLLPDPEDCSSYFHCISGGRYYHKTCSFGLRFDNRHKICSWASLVHCNIVSKQDKTMPTDNRTESEKDNVQDPFEVKPYLSLSDIEKQRRFKQALLDKRFRKEEVEGSGDIGAEAFVDKDVSIMNKHKTQDTAIIRPSVKCVNAFSFLTDPLRCDVFYQCHMWIPYPKYCPKGLYFDDSTLVCNWPYSVNCANGRRKPVFEQVPMDEDANKIPTIQNTIVHDKKVVQDRTRNRSHLGVFLSSAQPKTNVESKLVKALNRRKATQDNYFHSTNSFSARHLPNRHNPFAPVMTTPPFSKREQQEIATSEKPASATIKETPAPREFNGNISLDMDPTDKGESGIRKTVVKKNSEKDSKVTAPPNYKPIVSSTIKMDGSVYLQRIYLNQSKENQTNNISETEIVRSNSESRKHLHDTGHSNVNNISNESNDFPKRLVKNKFMVKISESEQSEDNFLRNSKQRIANQSTSNERIILPSSTIVNNSILEEENYTRIKIDKEEYHLPFANDSNFSGNDEQMTINNDEFSSIIKNVSRSHNFTVGTDLNKYDTSVNSFENRPSVTKMSFTMSSEAITDKTPTSRILLDLFRTNNTNQSDLKAPNAEEPTTKSYLLVNRDESKSSTKTAEKPSIVPSFSDSSDNLLTSKIPANASAYVNSSNRTNTEQKEAIHLEKLNQPSSVPGEEYESTERINVFKDPKVLLLTPTNHSIQDSKSEVVRDHKQEKTSVLSFPPKDVLDSNGIDQFINQNISDDDNLNKTSKNHTSIDRNSNLGSLRSTKDVYNRTKNEISSSNLVSKDFRIDSSTMGKQEKLIDTHNENIAGPGKKTKPSLDTDEQHNGNLEPNRTYIEHEMSSLVTSSVKSKNENLITKILKTQHDKYGMGEQKSSIESTGVTTHTNAHNSTMENLNGEHVECSNVMITGEVSMSTSDVKAGNGTESEMKTTKTINETDGYKNVPLPKFSFRKNKIKNHEPIKIFLHRKLVELFNNFLPGPENTATLLKRIRKMRDKLLKEKNESEFVDKENYTSFSRIPEKNLQKGNVSVQTTRPQYIESKSKSIETTTRYEISISEMGKPVKETSDRTVTSLRNGSKIVVNDNILHVENSSNNIKGSDKIGDYSTINTSSGSQGVNLQFSEPIQNSKEMQQGNVLSNLNSSVEVESANGSVVPQNLNQNIKMNSNQELLTNIQISTNTVLLNENIKTSKANGIDNIHPDVNTDHSKNKTNDMFYDMVSLGNRMSTLNTLIVDTSQEDKTYNQSYQKRDVEKVETTDSNGAYVNISKYGITDGLGKNESNQSQSVASNVSEDLSSREKKNIEHVVGNALKRDESLKNLTSKGSDNLNISVNTTESTLGRWGNVFDSSNETTFSRRSKDIVLPDQKQVTSQQQLYLGLEPEEEFIEA